jgi:hypothetical protein
MTSPFPAPFGTSHAALRVAPVVLVGVAVSVIGLRGLADPITWLLLAPCLLGLLAYLLVVAPLAVFLLVPLGMCWYTPLPLLPYEGLVFVLAGIMGLSALAANPSRKWVLQPVEGRYLLFLLAMLPGIPSMLSMFRFGSSIKHYSVGILGFEVARHAARRFGRPAMLAGPIGLMLITISMLALRMAELGVPSFKGIVLRTYLTRLTWGTSNYVAAVLVLCLPAAVLLIRESPARSHLRTLGVVALAGTLASMFFTLSRGGFLLCMLYLLSLVRSGPRARWLTLGGALLLTLAVTATPLGKLVVSRFTNTDSLASVYGRIRIWQAAWHRGVTHLPFGVGTGQNVIQTDELGKIDTHNFLLSLFAENGPLGVVLWLSCIVALWQAARRLVACSKTTPAGEAIQATVVLALLNSMFEPTLTSSLYNLLFWWLIGIYHGVGAPADLQVPQGATVRPAGSSVSATT